MSLSDNDVREPKVVNIIYATTNKYKLAGANNALRGTDVELIAPKQELPDVPEIQSDSQEAVSVDKAEKYFQLLKCSLVVMDSGLFIEELKGFPGIYTKYALDTVGIKRIIEMLNDNFRAYTKRTVVYHDGSATKVFTSEIWGNLVREPQGDNGRNYDKYFIPDGDDKTIAEMSDDEKAAMIAPVWREFAKWIQRGTV